MANMSTAFGTMTINAPNKNILFKILKNHRDEKQDSQFYTRYYTDLEEIEESLSDQDLLNFIEDESVTVNHRTILALSFDAIGRWEYDNNIRNFVMQDLTKNLPESLVLSLNPAERYLSGRFEYHDEEDGCGVDCDVITEYTYNLESRTTTTRDVQYISH